MKKAYIDSTTSINIVKSKNGYFPNLADIVGDTDVKFVVELLPFYSNTQIHFKITRTKFGKVTHTFLINDFQEGLVKLQCGSKECSLSLTSINDLKKVFADKKIYSKYVVNGKNITVNSRSAKSIDEILLEWKKCRNTQIMQCLRNNSHCLNGLTILNRVKKECGCKTQDILNAIGANSTKQIGSCTVHTSIFDFGISQRNLESSFKKECV